MENLEKTKLLYTIAVFTIVNMCVVAILLLMPLCLSDPKLLSCVHDMVVFFFGHSVGLVFVSILLRKQKK